MSREVDVAWAAGLYEGEGSCFNYTSNSKTNASVTIRMSMGMCDEEPLRRFAEIVGFGNVNGPYQDKRPNARPTWHWSIEGWTRCQAVADMLWEHLSERRQDQITNALMRRPVKASRTSMIQP